MMSALGTLSQIARSCLGRESKIFRMPDETQFTSLVHFCSDSNILHRKEVLLLSEEKKKLHIQK